MPTDLEISLNRSCSAIVLESVGKPLALQMFALPVLAPGEALVRMGMATICGSDLHTYEGHRSTPTPTILGHEILGEVVEIGPGDPPENVEGAAVRVGQRITWSVAASCGTCFYCSHELPQKCERLFKYGHEVIRPGRELSGGLAEYCHLQPGTAIVPLPDSLPDEVACPANCATATVVAAFRMAGGCDGENVLIQGAGMLGLTACAMAVEKGAKSVLVTDIDAGRLACAQQFGASATIDVRTGDDVLNETVAAHSDGRGVDVAIELSGAAAAVESAIGQLRIGGRCILVGSASPGPAIPLDPEQIVRRLITIRGLHNYAPRDLREAVTFLDAAHTRYPFAELVRETFPLARAEEAIRHALVSGAPRVAIVGLERGPEDRSAAIGEKQVNNPLHGVTLEKIVSSLYKYYGWDQLGKRIAVRCFTSDPSVQSSLKFLRKTPWARKKVEALYIAAQKKTPGKFEG